LPASPQPLSSKWICDDASRRQATLFGRPERPDAVHAALLNGGIATAERLNRISVGQDKAPTELGTAGRPLRAAKQMCGGGSRQAKNDLPSTALFR
jgi:hypothetical protein